MLIWPDVLGLISRYIRGMKTQMIDQNIQQHTSQQKPEKSQDGSLNLKRKKNRLAARKGW